MIKNLEFRQCITCAIDDLSIRCADLDRQLRKQQPPSVRRVAGKISIGLMTVLSLLMQWPDHQLPMRFVIGFQAVGDLEVSHVWKQLTETSEPVAFTKQERTEYLKSIAARPMDEYTDFIWDSLLAEVEKGVADPPVTANALDRIYGTGK